MKILEELYYGNLAPYEKYFKKGDEYDRVITRMNEKDERLRGLLNEEENELYDEFKDLDAQLTDITLRDTFITGFRLGAMMTREVIEDER